MKDDNLDDVQKFNETLKALSNKMVKPDVEYKLHYCSFCDGFHKTPKPECLAFPLAADSVGKQTNVYERMVWNDAIEAVITHYENDECIAIDLRRLKK